MALREQRTGTGIEGVVETRRGPSPWWRALVALAWRHASMSRSFAPCARNAACAPRRPHEFADAERVGQPFEFDAVLLFQFEQPLLATKARGSCRRCRFVRAALPWRISSLRSDPLSLIRIKQGTGRQLFDVAKRMGPGALERRRARHLRQCEGFLSTAPGAISGSDSASALRSGPADVFGIVANARRRLASVDDLNRAETLRLSKVTGLPGGVMLLSKSGPTDLCPLQLRVALIA